MSLDPEIEIRRLEREVEDLSIELARFESLREKTPEGEDTVEYFLEALDRLLITAPDYIELEEEHERLKTEYKKLNDNYEDLKLVHQVTEEMLKSKLEARNRCIKDTQNRFRELTKSLRSVALEALILLIPLMSGDRGNDLNPVKEKLNAIYQSKDPILETVSDSEDPEFFS